MRLGSLGGLLTDDETRAEGRVKRLRCNLELA